MIMMIARRYYIYVTSGETEGARSLHRTKVEHSRSARSSYSRTSRANSPKDRESVPEIVNPLEVLDIARISRSSITALSVDGATREMVGDRPGAAAAPTCGRRSDIILVLDIWKGIRKMTGTVATFLHTRIDTYSSTRELIF